MKSSTFTYKDQDDIEIFVYKWEPDSGDSKAVVQISHGLAEHALRYQDFAEFLTNNGFTCYADDHRGHGKSIKDGQTGYLGPNGWDGTVNSIHELTTIIKKENPDKPVFYFGHSWGSLLGQDILQQFGSDYKGAVLSGTAGSMSKVLLMIGGIIARRAAKKDPVKQNPKLNDMTFGSYNKRWKKEPGATGFEWLSSDKDQVKKYVDDPLCGFASSSSYYAESIHGLNKIWNKKNEMMIPKDLPIYFMSGQFDPVSGETKTVKTLIKKYKSYGISDIEFKFYDEGRHEMLNEVNKEDVYNDVNNWLQSHL